MIDDVWDQNDRIERVMPDEKDRTFDFTGILTTVNFTEVDITKTEEKLTASFCAERAKAISAPRPESVVKLDPQRGAHLFDQGTTK